MATTWVWLRHPETGGVNRFPEAAAKSWQARGWEPCDKPAEPPWRQDPRYVDLPAAQAAKPAPAVKPAAPKSPAPAGEKKEKADG